MIQVKKSDILSYHPDMGGDPLKVEKGWSHFTRQGRKDFLDYITGYEPNEHGICFEVNLPGGIRPGGDHLRQ